MKRVRYHPEARAEFLREIQYYASFSAGLAERYDQSVRKAEHAAAATPEAWPRFGDGTRRVIDRKFKFSLVYLEGEDEIHVIAVAPARRRPGYWKARL